MTTPRRFTSRELDIIEQMRARKISYRAIGERLGRSRDVIKYAVWRRPKPADKRAQEAEALISAFSKNPNVTITQIAESRGWTIERTIMRMNRAGFDAEMRSLARASE